MFDTDEIVNTSPIYELTSELARFVRGGKATFTIQGQKNRYTFRVRVAKDNPKIFFVSLLTAPDFYTYVGLLGADSIKHTARSKICHDAPAVQAFNWFWRRTTQNIATTGMTFWHAGRCACCNRMLTDPISIARGIGPECFSKNGFA